MEIKSKCKFFDDELPKESGYYWVCCKPKQGRRWIMFRTLIK